MPDKRSLNILLIGNYLLDGQESMLRFADSLKQGLEAAGHRVELLQPPAALGRLAAHPSLKKWLGYVDKYLIFPGILRRAKRGADVIHICDHSNAMYGRWLRGKPWIITCNDLLAVRSALGEFPENPTRRTGRLLQKWILSSLRQAPHIACISAATQADVLRLTGLSQERTSIVHMDLNFPFARREPTEWQPVLAKLFKSAGIGASQPYIFHVGGNQWYKNRLGVVAIFSALVRVEAFASFKLVLAGKALPPELALFVSEHQLGLKVISLENVTGPELEALYHGAECLLFPSLAEGFGWPVIEAQACGCPVVTSDRPPLTEIGGEGAAYAMPTSIDQVTNVLSLVLQESLEAQKHRRDRGLRNATRFASGHMIEMYMRLYHNVCSL